MSDDPVEAVRREMKRFRELCSARVEIGSIEAESTRWPSAGRDMDALFPPLEAELKAVTARFDELGLSHLLGPDAVQYIGKEEEQVAAALGVEHCTARTFDPRENEAFFLVCFAELLLDASRQLVGDRSTFNSLLRLGRLMEWWRWRRLGLDQYALDRKQAVRAFRDIGEHNLKLVNQERRGLAAERNAAIRAIAANSGLKGAERDRHAQAAMEAEGFERPSTRTIRRARARLKN